MNTDKCNQMPSLANRNDNYSSSGIWSNDVDGINYNQLHKFWSDLPLKARQELLRIDKQALFEQARKNMCCARCNGLLLEGFLQIVSYGRSKGVSKESNSVVSSYNGAFQDPEIHHWGGLSTTKDGLLTVMDCYLYAKSFKGIQTVFENGRKREKEREKRYPNACGGGGRVWLSQGMVGYGKGYGTREACALHTTMRSCDTLVNFWSALEEENRNSLLRIKEEDFIERLTYRFDYKKFCRDCRRNVIREFKELKEINRMQREPRCTNWFCCPDTAFQYELDFDSARADWSECFPEYNQFEWAIGTGEGDSDILNFKSVGKDRSAQATDLDLGGLHKCYITVRAIKKNSRSSQISVKANALRGQQCVHSRLVVGDGFVSVKRGECIRMFFEHAEEVEEEEDEVMVDIDGKELDGECLRPQKHAKSPELAREFLLDAATVIFKEQVEKAFREGTARRNSHMMFVCLSTKLLEQRVHIACKEIVTLEKQNKLLEEEEKEKLEEEEKKERKRSKEREKKLRRKERLKEKEREKNPKSIDKAMLPNVPRKEEEEDSPELDEETTNTISCEELGTETEHVDLLPLGTPDDQDEECFDDCREELHNCDRETIDHDDVPVHKTARYWKEIQPDRCSDKRNRAEGRYLNGSNTNVRVKAMKASGSPNSKRSHEGCQCSDNHSSSCEPFNGYKEKMESNISYPGVSKPVNPTSTYTQSDYRPISNVIVTQNPPMMDTVKDIKVEETEDVSSAVKSADTLSQCNGKEELGKKMEVVVPMMSRTSSSDNCCSCVSEGDNNTASSDKGISTSEQSDEREILPASHETVIEKSIDGTSLPVDKNGGTPFTVPTQNMENTVHGHHSQPQSMMFPQMLNQNIPMSVFHAPSTMGYYHQPPVSWSDGLMPFGHANHYVYTTPLGYSLNGESPLCVQYGTPLNHSATPFLNPSSPVPVFHPPVGTPRSAGMQTESDESFSLFHSGGPVGLSTKSKLNPPNEKQSKVTEEYNLFATSNNLRFSIF